MSIFQNIFDVALKQSPLLQLLYDNTTTSYKSNGKLNALQEQTNSKNICIPIIYGTARVGGNILEQSAFIETQRDWMRIYANGYRQAITEYEYFVNLKIGICQHKAELKNIWINDKLVPLDKYDYIFHSEEPLTYIEFSNFPITQFANKIPTFNFEISRVIISTTDIENTIQSINLIPASGEFVYSPTIIKKLGGVQHYGQWHSDGNSTAINQNSNTEIADAVVSTQQLKNTLPNCNWVSPVVAWFGDSLDIANCNIEPKTEFSTPISTEPYLWNVGNYNRQNANVVGADNEKIRYGGTISDNAVLDYFTYLKEQEFSTMFCPILLMDIENKPWRGYITGETADLETFFTKYTTFILHYANLLIGKVDCFLIGSELKGITAIAGAVPYLIALAQQVKAILGNDVLVSYAADWSEYHHTEGGVYNLDSLWASPYIDFVGIDVYMPLTNAIQENIDYKTIYDSWSNYTDAPEYDWKNIEWWWKNPHINPNGQQTEWQPESKPIWFTEFGFASVNGTTNEPNKFYDPNSVDGGLPALSDGKINIMAQRIAIEATINYWNTKSFVENKFLYCWDARPYPYFPARDDVWSDSTNYYYGHWIQGKVGLLTFKNLIKMLFIDNNISLTILGDIEIDDVVDGIVLNKITTLNEVIKILQGIYFFDYIERDGKLHFLKKYRNVSYEIDEGELVEFEKNVFYKVNMLYTLPYKIIVGYLNRDDEYKMNCVEVEQEETTNSVLFTELPIIVGSYKAELVSVNLLKQLWNENEFYELKLLPTRLELYIGEVLLFKGIELKIIDYKVNDNWTLQILCVKNVKYNTLLSNDNMKVGQIGFEFVKFVSFELPNIDDVTFFAIYGTKKGGKIYNSAGKFVCETKTNAIVGDALSVLEDDELYVVIPDYMQIDFDSGDCLIGNEIVKFGAIEKQENNTYKISNIERENITSHTTGEKFIVLDRGIVGVEKIVEEEYIVK